MICKCGYGNTPENEPKCLMCGEKFVGLNDLEIPKECMMDIISVDKISGNSFGTLEVRGTCVVITIPFTDRKYAEECYNQVNLMHSGNRLNKDTLLGIAKRDMHNSGLI